MASLMAFFNASVINDHANIIREERIQIDQLLLLLRREGIQISDCPCRYMLKMSTGYMGCFSERLRIGGKFDFPFI
jgi:hypothetical protein